MFIVKKRSEIVRFGLFLVLICLMVYYVAGKADLWRASRESAGGPAPVNGPVPQGGTAQMPAEQGDGRDFFADFRIERDRDRGAHRETLKEVMENPGADAEVKKEAARQYLKLGEIALVEARAERLVKAGGFDDAVVNIFEGSAQVMVKAASVSELQFRQILEIVSRTTGVRAVSIAVKARER